MNHIVSKLPYTLSLLHIVTLQVLASNNRVACPPLPTVTARWSKPPKLSSPSNMRALPHCPHSINIVLQFCQAVIYGASPCSLWHLIWWQWLIYLWSSFIPCVKGMLSPRRRKQMLSISCRFALWRLISQLYLRLYTLLYVIFSLIHPYWTLFFILRTYHRGNTEGDDGGFCSLFSNCYWLPDLYP